MKLVEIYKLNNDGTQSIAVVCKLAGDNVICSGDEALANNLMTSGIADYAQPAMPKLFPKDGIRFLEQLKFNFRSGYLNASDVKDE
jgi:hypothetical protein